MQIVPGEYELVLIEKVEAKSKYIEYKYEFGVITACEGGERLVGTIIRYVTFRPEQDDAIASAVIDGFCKCYIDTEIKANSAFIRLSNFSKWSN